MGHGPRVGASPGTAPAPACPGLPGEEAALAPQQRPAAPTELALGAGEGHEAAPAAEGPWGVGLLPVCQGQAVGCQ